LDHLTEKPSLFFTQWAKNIIRYRWALIALTLLSVVGSGWFVATQIKIDMGIEAFTDHGSKAQQYLEEFRDDFGRDDVWIIALEGDVFSSAYLAKLRALHQELESINIDLPSLGQRKSSSHTSPEVKADSKISEDDFMDEDGQWGDGDDGWGEESEGSIFDDVLSLINTKETKAVADGIQVADLLPNALKESELSELKRRVLVDPSIVGQMVNQEGTVSLVLLRSQFMSDEDTMVVTEKIRQLLAASSSAEFVSHLAGLPTLNSDLTYLSMSNMLRLFTASILLMVLILYWLFRHPLGVVGPMSVVMISSINTFGFMAFFGFPITMLSMILPSFIICVGLGDSVHLISIYRDFKAKVGNNHESLILALGSTGKPILYTSLTTMVGLLSFRFASLEGIQYMGIAGAFGVSMACLHSLVILPICISFATQANFNTRLSDSEEGSSDQGVRQPDRLDRFLTWCNRLSSVDQDDGRGEAPPEAKRRRRNTLLWGAVLLVSLIAALTQLRVYHNPMSWLGDDHQLNIAFDLMDQKMGGSADIHLLIDGPKDHGIRDLELLRGLERLEKHMSEFKHPKHGEVVGPILSPLSVIRSTNRALNGGGAEHYVLPDTQQAVTDQFFLFENSGPDQLKRLATNDLSRGRFSMRLRWIEANGYAPVTQHLERGIKEFIPDHAQVKSTGTAYSLLSTIGRLIIDLGRSFGFACVLIMGLLMLQLKSVKLGLIAMVPNLSPIIFVMGVMAIVGIPIDMVNILIASIAIGIAVDDTIHMLHHFRAHFDQYGNVEAAIDNAFEHAGRAMVSTSTVLGIGFFAFSFATIANIQRFGVLIALTAVAAMLIDLIFTPALLRLFYDRMPKDQA
jgi:predicted RND superfamily exporter protein